jgi:hypothetical protein
VIEDKAEYQRGLTTEQLNERQRVPVDFHAIINPEIDLLTLLMFLSMKAVSASRD